MKNTENGYALNSKHLLLDIVFDVPNFEVIRNERQKRNFDILNNIDVSADSHTNIQHHAAILIQKTFRGFLGRKKYLDLLYQSVKEGEEALHSQEIRQITEGEILVESYRMEQELLDLEDVNNNKLRLKHKSATLIQRAWRQHHKNIKEHICCPCKEDYPDVYDYYKETKEICFCCDYHKEHSYIVEERYLEIEDHDILPSPTTDWLHVESLLSDNNNYRRGSDLISSTEISEIKSRFTVDQDVKLTFVESYESANDIEITYDNVEVSELIENVTDNKSSDILEPIEESQRVLHSLKIHEEHEKKSEKSRIKPITVSDLLSKSKVQLKQIIEDLNNSISEKNLELVNELTTRDDLNSKHEALLMEADDLEERKSINR